MHALRLRADDGTVTPLRGWETFVPLPEDPTNTFRQKFADELVGQRVWLHDRRVGTVEQARPPREMTADETRYLLIQHIKGLVRYWAEHEDPKTVEERLSGLAFSILSTLDGSNLGLPGFSVVSSPHPDDKEYNRDRGVDWFPETDIGGLHELYHHNPKPNL